jgi:NADH dehydrogenase [ubiquinone] 1 alpha subcomplex assembly factor 1
MKYLLVGIILITIMNMELIFDFNKNSDIQNWNIIDDVVMGGKSGGSFGLSPDGFGVFQGEISLENNGGFSSVRYQFKPLKVNKNGRIVIKLKGDGKDYQFRIKDNSSNYYSYIMPFTTSGEWEDIEISLKDMYPTFRGRKLDLPNFSNDSFEQIVFLIGNKKSEKFELLIDKIELR